jgi:hypothetical protein
MAADSRRQLTLLAILAVTLLAALWWRLGSDPAPAPALTSPRDAASRKSARPEQSAAVEIVRLDSLAAARVKPEQGRRDPFQFAAPPMPPHPVFQPMAPGTTPSSQPPVALAPAPPPGPPPMQLKFIGILKPTSTAPIAVLTDGKNVFYGREGETIEGRYRIERIGVESVEMAWADGQGRQVIRLSGS